MIGRRTARLHINALSAANAELDAMSEFSQAAQLAAQDRLPAARERMAQSLSFLAYAPKPLTVAAHIRLARVERGIAFLVFITLIMILI